MKLFEPDIIHALKVLEAGGTLLYPTDTIWGIGCDATNAAAVDKVFQIKNRPPQKSLVVLVADEKQVLQHVAAIDLCVFDFLAKQQKPTTVIYPAAIGFANNVIAENGSIAIRICQDPFCKQLIKRFKKPIVSTSANLSGEPSPANFASISETIRSSVDYVVQYRQDDKQPSVPSTIIEWRQDGSIHVLRP
ncbi:MAG: threonylcarbamoyl-AMP synthase [Hydrotalea flava]|uniref:L-threonylcarbamoyladenylate synthase n=1 Tax=Hydrotalea TaxID=1004300 RepID=UPI00094564A8|nr:MULTISPECIES: L-threonylcarbamoyladenylate synthase [Hydrotalea]MBY0347890.1 threonylcarbamoyl-AMP synthase [Hydrotalea flava]NIM36230.1 threonylcarbamoyl-AMP synthase [Hydrotalea flava]NIM39081.1 threonylcarbamoyl-AMP synthase [Hydrotalea flava]NIN04316.1 threonylcarbamoyl-AMP synthase [Hydrotalea flava]NIN15942.1 threonylcarbamoyl-AMP synthase [Hydrotalea flava]